MATRLQEVGRCPAASSSGRQGLVKVELEARRSVGVRDGASDVRWIFKVKTTMKGEALCQEAPLD